MLSFNVFEDIISIIKLLFGESKYHVQPCYFQFEIIIIKKKKRVFSCDVMCSYYLI